MTVVDGGRGGGARADGRRFPLPVVALVVASVLLVGTAAMAALGAFGAAPWRVGATTGTAYGFAAGGGGMMAGNRDGVGAMMSGQVWLPGDGAPVGSIAEARARGAQAGASRGLHPGEVMQFANNFYVELKDSTGAATTEVLVDPASGAVQTEPGPAMMWNTGSRTGTVTEARARQAASDWLASNRPGESVLSVDAYPGYYTIDTEAGGKVVGMLSVNATSGAVWYHTWHGTFVAMEDA